MRGTLLAVLALTFTGCISAQKTESHAFKDFAEFGVRIVRPGMKASEVSQLLGPTGCSGGSGQWPIDGFPFIYSSGLEVTFADGNFLTGTVRRCKAPNCAVPGIESTLQDTEIQCRLRVGMTPRQVEEQIGVAKCGFENEPGTIHLIYIQPGIEVIYDDGKLKSWRRTHTYVPVAEDQVGM